MQSFIKMLFSLFKPTQKKRQIRGALVKPRPISYQERYTQIENEQKIFSLFERFNTELKLALKEQNSTRSVFMEQGRFSDGTKFMYYKPMNQKGIILETTANGWTISRAEKIPTQKMFLKNTTDLWDNIKLLDATDTSVVRVASKQNKSELPVFSVYTAKAVTDLINEMRIESK